MKKLTLNDHAFEINGLPWFKHNGGHFWRLPYGLKDRVSKALWEKSCNTSGGRIRFSSNTTLLGLLTEYLMDAASPHFNIGRLGIDLYVDGIFWNNVMPQHSGINEGVFFEFASRKHRQFTIYLPLHHAMDVQKILLDDHAEIASPVPFALEQPVVFYGTSVTQGGSASRAGLSYQAQMSRKLNIDFVNLGFSALGRGDLPVAQAMAEMDAACYVLDFAQNNTDASELQKVYEPFLATIRGVKTKTPVILTTPITNMAELWNDEVKNGNDAKRQIIKDVYLKYRNQGDDHIYLLEWEKELPCLDGEGSSDGAHPNDIGFMRMSEVIAKYLKSIFDLLQTS